MLRYEWQRCHFLNQSRQLSMTILGVTHQNPACSFRKFVSFSWLHEDFADSGLR